MMIADAGRILVCLRYGIGDLVMQLPALNALRRANAQARITAVGAEPAIELLGDGRLADRVLSVHRFGLGHWGDFGDETRRAAILRWLAEECFDAIFDPTHAATGFGAAVWETGHPAIYDSGNVVQESELLNGAGGSAAVNAAARHGWGLDLPSEAVPRLRLTGAEMHYAEDFFNRHGLAAGEPLAVSPVASSPLKQWPIERMARVAAATAGKSPVLLFAADDNSLLTGWQAAVDGINWITVPRVHLRRTAALLQRCRLLLCNDTGLMHLAAAVGTPVGAVFGPTSATIYCPPESQAASAPFACPHRKQHAFGPPACVISGGCVMGLRSCIDDVGVDEVVELAAKISKGTGGAYGKRDGAESDA